MINSKEGVYSQVSRFIQFYSNIWWSTKNTFPLLQDEISYWHKRNQEKETDKFINEFFRAVEQFPQNKNEHAKWKENVQILINDFVNKSDLICPKDREILLDKELIQVTENFIGEIKKIDPNMDIEDIGQALRNVWIVNLIQLLFGKRPELTPSIFGYSMLYPCTDNYLDDTEISKEDKIRINKVFQRRLEGEKINPSSKYEESLFKLIEKIEEQYDRNDYPEIYESLLCIHEAQSKSLEQQGKLCGPYEKDILGISMEKGGSSVLADAYLVNGTLSEQAAKFSFGYGILLQICDDLQDGKKDLEDQHMTIVSQLYRKWYLDDITNKLINFTHDLIYNAECFNVENINDLKSLIYRNCTNLILFAVIKNKKMYSREYVKKVQRYLPYRPRYMAALNKKLNKRFSTIKESYNGVETSKIILYALKG